MFTKTSVRGKDASPLYKQLAASTGKAPGWNFHKYLVARDGVSVRSFNTHTDPASASFVAEIEKQLAHK
jgi:glutathione peroxidase